MRRRRERRTFLTEVRLTETEASERRHSSRFWRESLPGRLLGWVPGVSVEPKGDVKKARRAAAEVAQRRPAPGCLDLRRRWAAECRAGRLSASAAALCCARSLALHDCIAFWLLARSPRRQHDGCLPSRHASPHVSVGHGPKVPAETCGSRPAWRERRLGAPAQELRHHDAAGAVEALMDSAGDSPFRERVVAHGAAFGDAADSRRARRSRRGARRAGHADVLFHRRRPCRGERYGCLTTWQNMVVLKDPITTRLARLTNMCLTCFQRAHPPPRARCELDKDDAATWHVDPLRCALPAAPSLQLFSLYGVGLPTERSYQYINYVTPRARALPCSAALLLRRAG